MTDEQACAHCSTDFACGCLSSALHIAELCPDLDQRPKLRALIARVRGLLEQARWDYPDRKAPCLLAGNDRTIQRLTKELIDELGNLKTTVKLNNAEPPGSQLAEEYRHD